jgi:hypothetical protein
LLTPTSDFDPEWPLLQLNLPKVSKFSKQGNQSRCAFMCAFVARHIPIPGCVMALIENCVFFHFRNGMHGIICM